MIDKTRHDPNRFYHCDCLDEYGLEHDDRFYHCDCLEGGYTPPDDHDEE